MEGKKAFALIFCQGLINIVVLAAELNSSRSRSAYFVIRENKRLMNRVVKRFTSPSLLLCSQSCLRKVWCTSLNFETISQNGKGTCELNRSMVSAIDTEGKLHDQEGVIFSMMLKVI